MKKKFNFGVKICKPMNIPNLPTDNLYKFGFVFSLIIAIFLFYSFNEKKEYFEKYNIDLEFRSIDLDLKYAKFTEEYKIIEKKFNENPTDKEGEILSLKFELIENQKLKMDSILSVYNKSVDVFNDDFKSFNTNIKYYKLFIGFSFLIAVFFAVLWYLKGQRYEDFILKSKVDEIINKKL